MLKDRLGNVVEGHYIERVNALLHQKVLLEDRLGLIEQSTQGMEDRVRRVVHREYASKINSLE